MGRGDGLWQIIYVSKASAPLEGEGLSDLLRASRRNNHMFKVSGFLVQHDGCFLQVLEGPSGPLKALFGQIARDERHSNLWVLLDQPIARKDFAEWSMAFIDASKEVGSHAAFVNFLDRIEQVDQRQSIAHRVLSNFREEDWRRIVHDRRTEGFGGREPIIAA